MAESSRLRWPYPNENEDPWYLAFQRLVEAMDASVYTTREDRSSVLMSTATFTFNVVGINGNLTWDQPIDLLSPIAGFLLSVSAGGVNLLDGDMLYMQVVRYPLASMTLSFNVVRSIPNTDDALLIAIRRGNIVYFRGGRALGNGDSVQLFSTAGGNSYAPANPSDWFPAPTVVPEALDQLAARVYSLETSGIPALPSEVYGCPVTVAVGDAVYLSTGDTVDKASATGSGTTPAIGFVVLKPTLTSARVQYQGSVTGFVGLISGLTYYLSTTPGGVVDGNTANSQPPGSVVQKLGFARNSTTLVAQVDQDLTIL